MNESSIILLLCVLVPMFAAFLVWLNSDRPNVRDATSIVTTVILFGLVLKLYPAVLAGETLEFEVATLVANISLKFSVEPLGLMFATIASGLWIITTLYAIGYMRGNNEKHHTRFFFCFAFSIGAAMGIAFSDNLLTLFIFYEVLTLSTYPLVTHKGTDAARQGGRNYLSILLTTSIGFLLPAIIWTYASAGTLDFIPGGVLAGQFNPAYLPLLIALFAFGIGKAALMPFHKWLPSAMVAPTPVSALLHAVAVVKAGVFTMMKVMIYTVGLDFAAMTSASMPIAYVACFTLTVASLIAMQKDNLKARLAYSTIGQLSYVVLGIMLANQAGVFGGAMQIAMHAMGKITLFFCAGAIYVATHKTEISDMQGLGRKMPFTFAAFFIASLSIIGLPPLGGSWAKFYLIMGSLEAEQMIIVAALLLSSLLNIAYLLPIVARAFFLPLPDSKQAAPMIGHESNDINPLHVQEAPILCLMPLIITAAGSVALFFYADAIYALIALIPLSGG